MSNPGTDEAGRRTERLAAWFLRCKGYQILAHRFDTPVGEIDLILRKRHLLVFAEVKLRQAKSVALLSVSPKQQIRITRAAGVYLKFNPQYAQMDLRFDVIVFGRWTWPTHIQDAWRPGH